MKNQVEIDKLRQIIYDALDPHINGNYYLLDYPNNINVGDMLIWKGQLTYLQRFHYQCKYSSSIDFFDNNNITNTDLILFSGGGNFGDIWRKFQDFRLKIIQQYPNNKIVIFPQSVFYENIMVLEEDMRILDAHLDLTICVRDNNSFRILKNYLKNATVLLVPDIAFCLDFESVSSNVKTGQTLFLNRIDKERSSENYLLKIPHLDSLKMQDWPQFERKVENYLLNKVRILGSYLYKYKLFKIFLNNKSGLQPPNFYKDSIEEAINLLNQYDNIYTTRLHGLILAILLNKKVFVLDNMYSKNKNFYETWLKDFKKVICSH